MVSKADDMLASEKSHDERVEIGASDTERSVAANEDGRITPKTKMAILVRRILGCLEAIMTADLPY